MPGIYNILIVDDEPIVIHSLCKQIDWESYSLKLAGTAESAKSALSILEQKTVDILFTDICMSKMDGLSLIKEAKAKNPFLRCVVISSYSAFGYVKKALLLGVENYLLKPIDQNELNKTIEKTINNLKRDLISAKKGVTDISSFKENILDRWVNAAIQEYEFLARAELLDIDLSAHQYQVLVLAVFNADTEEQKLIDAKTLLKECRNVFFPAFPGESFIDRFNHVVIILNGSELETRQDELRQLVEKITASRQKKKMRIFASIGPASSGVENVAHDYSNAADYLYYRFIAPNSRYMFFQESKRQFNLLGFEPLEIQLEKALIGEDPEKAKDIVSDIFEKLSCIPLETAKKVTIHFLIMIIKQMNESGHTAQVLPNAATTEFSALSAMDSIEDVNEWFADIVRQSFDIMGSRKDSLHLLVQRTLGIIKKSYHTDLSLKTISADFKVTPSYLGQLFKEETEKYFNDYLMETRLKASRELLLETDLKIKEIVYRIGMSNQSYFNLVFKKAYGISPLAFRYQGKNNKNKK